MHRQRISARAAAVADAGAHVLRCGGADAATAFQVPSVHRHPPLTLREHFSGDGVHALDSARGDGAVVPPDFRLESFNSDDRNPQIDSTHAVLLMVLTGFGGGMPSIRSNGPAAVALAGRSRPSCISANVRA